MIIQDRPVGDLQISLNRDGASHRTRAREQRARYTCPPGSRPPSKCKSLAEPQQPFPPHQQRAPQRIQAEAAASSSLTPPPRSDDKREQDHTPLRPACPLMLANRLTQNRVAPGSRSPSMPSRAGKREGGGGPPQRLPRGGGDRIGPHEACWRTGWRAWSANPDGAADSRCLENGYASSQRGFKFLPLRSNAETLPRPLSALLGRYAIDGDIT